MKMLFAILLFYSSSLFALDNVYCIQASSPGEPDNQGVCWKVRHGSNSYIITCAHCVKPLGVHKFSDKEEWKDATLVFYDREMDIAILTSPKLKGGLRLEDQKPITVLGYTAIIVGGHLVRTPVELSHKLNEIGTFGAAWSGLSGSPMMRNGRVIGMVYAMRIGQAYALSISSEALTYALKLYEGVKK